MCWMLFVGLGVVLCVFEGGKTKQKGQETQICDYHQQDGKMLRWKRLKYKTCDGRHDNEELAIHDERAIPQTSENV